MATAQGEIKKTPLSEFKEVRRNGKIAMDLEKGDQFVAAKLVHENDEVVMITSNGQAIRFPVSVLRSASRTSGGVRGIKLDKGGKVVSLEVVTPGHELFWITEKGFGKRTPFEEYRVTNRGGQGVRNYQITPKTGTVDRLAHRELRHGADRHQQGRHRHPHAHGPDPHDGPRRAGRLGHQRRPGRLRRVARDDRDGQRRPNGGPKGDDDPIPTTAPSRARSMASRPQPVTPKKGRKPTPIRGRQAARRRTRARKEVAQRRRLRRRPRRLLRPRRSQLPSAAPTRRGLQACPDEQCRRHAVAPRAGDRKSARLKKRHEQRHRSATHSPTTSSNISTAGRLVVGATIDDDGRPYTMVMNSAVAVDDRARSASRSTTARTRSRTCASGRA